ncbi:O-methyltransferase [Patescibacteria group bacterium]|nr:O-methyltransferase [Patescibacteria group bacterium]
MNKETEKVLREIEEDARQNGNPNWIISREVGEFLNNLIRTNNIKRVLEVGTSIGYSGTWLAEALSHTNGKLYTIESHENRFQTAKANFQKAGVEKYVEQIKGHAPDVAIPDMFDMLFLDATKVEYVSYLNTFLFHMRIGGIIVADNVLSHAEKMKNYKEYIENSPHLENELIEMGTGLYVSKVIA